MADVSTIPIGGGREHQKALASFDIKQCQMITLVKPKDLTIAINRLLKPHR